MLNKAVYKNLGLGVSANYNHFDLKDNFESPDNAWSSVSLAVGPQYTLPLNMFFIQLYGHIGMSLFKAPGITKDADNIPDYFDKYDEGFFNTFKMESESTTGFHTDIGVKVGAQLSKRLSVFVGSTYTTSLDSPIEYSSRDISKAFHPSGEIDTEMIRLTPFEKTNFAFSSYSVNAGISINLGKTSNARPAQDYNSSRSNKPSPIVKTDDEINNDSVPIPAQDYNSSRSNKPSPIRRIDNIDDIDNDEDEVVVIGKLTAIELKTRSFELIDKKGQKISGKFQPKVTNEEIKKLRHEFLNKQANIHVKINKAKIETGKIVIRYEL